MQPRFLFVIALTLYGFYFGWKHRELKQSPGILVTESPRQNEPSESRRRPIMIESAVLEPLAEYSLKARVLSTERYWTDPGSKISPIDLALGWGPLSDTAIIDQFKIQQRGRFYFYSWRNEPPLTLNEIVKNSANVHIIPSDDIIERQVMALRVGQIVEMSGYLVRANYKEGGEWKSSLSREDTGNGACELFYVNKLTLRN